MTIRNSGAALLHEQGCGKTLTAIAVVGRGFLDGKIKRLLIVAPLSVIPVWKKEFDQFADFEHSVEILQGAMKRRLQTLYLLSEQDGLQVAVINYESVWRELMFDGLYKWSPDMIIADESQRIKGHNTKQSKGLHKLGENVRYGLKIIDKQKYHEEKVKTPYKMILTGTPVTATPLDFWSQYRFLDPDIFGKSYYSFKNRYAVMGGYLNKQIVGFKNKQDLIEKAHSIAHRVTKQEALDLPEWVDQNLYCTLEPVAAKAYRDMKNESIMEIEALIKKDGKSNLIATNVLTRLLRLQQLTGGFIPEDPEAEEIKMLQVSEAKMDLLVETLADLLTAGHKVVVFARFVAEIEKILEVSRAKLKVEPGYIYGKVKHGARGQMVEKFQSDPECRIFVAQVQTAGLGITLHAADNAIFYSTDYNYGVYDQCKARIHRIGQRHNVNYIHLIAEKTVDEKIYKILRNKGNIAHDVVDRWREYLSGEA